MRPLLRAKPKPFLDEVRRRWQFDAFAWLLRGCGGYAHFLDTVLVLPVEEHFPDRGLEGHAAVAALFRRVREHAGMAEWPCVVEPERDDDDSAAASASNAGAPAPRDSGLRVIRYPRRNADPQDLVAHFAHEFARYLVETLDEPPPGGRLLRKPAVDLAAVFMGFGVFMTNAVARHARWQLNEGEFVHALALFCLLRRLPCDSVDSHLNPHVRKYLRLAISDLQQYEADFQRLRAESGAIDVGECTLPTAGG